MQANLPALKAHADAVDALFADTVERLNGLISAQSAIVQFDKSPMRDMALQGLQRSIVRGQDFQGCLAPYSRTLRAYVAEVEKKEG